MLLEDVGTYLQTAGLGTLGTDLFLGSLPLDAPNVSTQDAVIALFELPGFAPDYVHSPAGVSVEHPGLQILVRGAPYDYAGARTQAQEVFIALGKISNQVLSGTYYFWCMPMHSPWHLRQDDYSRPIFSMEFRCGKAV